MKDLMPEYLREAARMVSQTAVTLLSVGSSSYGFFAHPDMPPTNQAQQLPPPKSMAEDEDEVLMYIGR